MRASSALSSEKALLPPSISVAPIARLQAAMVHSSMQVAPCHPNISISTTERPIETSAAAPGEDARHQAQSRDQLSRAEQDQRDIQQIEMMQQKGDDTVGSKNAPGIADWSLLAIQSAAFGSSCAGV